MEITITLSDEQEKMLQGRASASGEDVEGYVRRVIDRHIKAPVTLAEVLAPIRHEFAGSGMNEEELDAIVEEAREEIWLAKTQRSEVTGSLTETNQPRSEAS
jgi:hypothetical protein